MTPDAALEPTAAPSYGYGVAGRSVILGFVGAWPPGGWRRGFGSFGGQYVYLHSD